MICNYIVFFFCKLFFSVLFEHLHSNYPSLIKSLDHNQLKMVVQAFNNTNDDLLSQGKTNYDGLQKCSVVCKVSTVPFRLLLRVSPHRANLDTIHLHLFLLSITCFILVYLHYKEMVNSWLMACIMTEGTLLRGNECILLTFALLSGYIM